MRTCINVGERMNNFFFRTSLQVSNLAIKKLRIVQLNFIEIEVKIITEQFFKILGYDITGI